MLFGWWDANGVPSAFYRLRKGAGDAHNFRFVYDSLRNSDAPKNSSGAENEALVVPIYDDLHKLSNTICWTTTDQGSTPPDQMVSAFQEYMGRIAGAWPSPENEFGQRFVGYSYKYAHVFAPGGETDWEHSGKLLVEGIRAGVPGVTGIGLVAWDLHYPLAYGYRIVEVRIGNDLVETGHYFKCKMGWGPYHLPEFHVAEDVWFGLSAHIWQKTSPTSADDTIAATFIAPDRTDVFSRQQALKFQQTMSNNASNPAWPGSFTDLPDGEFLSGPAACRSTHLTLKQLPRQNLHVFGRGTDNRVWRAHSPDGGNTWDVAWDAIGSGVFNSSPAACVSADGQNVHVFGRGSDNRMWRAHSPDAGVTWDVAWDAVGAGVFTSGPAACLSADGNSLHVFGRGDDSRIWRAYSPNGGATWDVAWDAIGSGLFTSNPAACVSADGKSLHVFGRGEDDRIYRTHSPDGGVTRDVDWTPVGDGVFLSSPAVAASADGQVIYLFGVGRDLKVWRTVSTDAGGSWALGWSPIPGGTTF